MSEPVLAILSVLAAVLVGLEQAPIPAPWGIVIKVAAVAVAAFTARSQTVSTTKATDLVATALKTETPTDPVESARKMVKP
jgi:hypothetical protein